MKKIADFIVNKRVLLLIIVLVITVVCGVLTMLVPSNTDMTKYLSNDSNMKQGLTIMNENFPEADENAGFRVMFDDLDGAEVERVLDKLKAIPYVSDVTYDAESESHNKDNHTLFLVNMKSENGSEEETAVLESLKSEFTEYKMVYSSMSTQQTSVPFSLIALALGVMLIVLFVMSESWLEPILYVATIGIAVIINLGTNKFLPYTAEITMSMGPILQLALSMDYSIMLMNRYRQEIPNAETRADAMKAALAKSFSPVASSCITTIVGLLALVFLSFKLGPELGIVLAKGVLISMLCVFVVLPFLILKFDKGLERSKKKSPHIRMGFLAKFSNKVRYIMPVLFIAMFVVFAVLQGNTGITFTEGNPDPVADVFPKDNNVILIYDDEDEDGAADILEALKDNKHITGLVGYGNTLGIEMNADDMAEAIASLGDGSEIDADMIKLLYYLHDGGKMPSITAGDFMSFIVNDVMSNEMISGYIGDEMNDYIDYLRKFSDKKNLTGKKTAAEMADFFDMDADDIKQLYLYYCTEKGGADTGSMNVTEFADFVINEVAENKTYSAMFDEQALAGLQAMQTFTDKAAMEQKKTYWEVAELMGLDEESAKMLFVYYYAKDDSFTPTGVTVRDFVDFMMKDVANNPIFAIYLNEDALTQIGTLKNFADKTTLQKQLSYRDMSKKLGIDEASAKLIYTYYLLENENHTPKSMTIREFIVFMQTEVANDPVFSDYIDEAALAQIDLLATLTEPKTISAKLTLTELANLLGMDEEAVKMVYLLYQAENGNDAVQAMEKPMSLETLSSTLGIGRETAALIYIRHYINDTESIVGKMTMTEFLTFTNDTIIGNDKLSAYISEDTLRKIQQAAGDNLSGDIILSYQETATLLNADENDIRTILIISDSKTGALSLMDACTEILSDSDVQSQMSETEYIRLVSKVMSLISASSNSAENTMMLEELVSFVLSSDEICEMLDAETLSQLQMLYDIISLAKSGVKVSYSDAASVLGMDSDSIRSIYILHDSADSKMTLPQTVAFMLSDETIGGTLDDATVAQLETLKKVMQYVVDDSMLSGTDISDLAGIDSDEAKMLLIYRDIQDKSKEKSFSLSVQETIKFLMDNKRDFSAFLGDSFEALTSAYKLIQTAVEETRFTSSELSKLLGMKKSQTEDLYYLYASEHGDISGWKLSPQEFVDFAVAEVLPNEAFSSYFDGETKTLLQGGKMLIDAVVSEKKLSAAKMGELVSGFSDEITPSTVEMLYLYYAGANDTDESRIMTIPGMLTYLCNDIMADERFSVVFDEKMRNDLADLEAQLEDAVAQMKSEDYSRLIITTDYPEESEETSRFMKQLDSLRKTKLDGESYMVGMSAMIFEMNNSFTDEYSVITLITAIAVFIVILFAFRNFLIAALLTLLVQGGVFITVTVIGWQSGVMYYLALLIVQSILMGATIDYAIVLSNYYCEYRATMDKVSALKAAYEGAIHTILTSGLILILATAVLGAFSTVAITAQVCSALSVGSLIAVLLILLVLPGILAAIDKWIVRRDSDGENT